MVSARSPHLVIYSEEGRLAEDEDGANQGASLSPHIQEG